MTSGIIETVKEAALDAYNATQPVALLFGKVISTNPVKIQIGDKLILTQEFLVINGTVFEGEMVTVIRCQGGQKYVVLGSRTEYVENTVYVGGGITATGGYQLPIKGSYTISSNYGMRMHPTKHVYKMHTGVDLSKLSSKLIYPINSGTVYLSRYYGDYGNTVIINHGNGYWSLYAHMEKKPYVKVGQNVNKNTILGVAGTTGASTGVHLHLEVRKGKSWGSATTVNPISFLNGK